MPHDSWLRLVCVTRAYPPVVGGMERLSLEFTRAIAEQAQTFVIANRGGKRTLPLFVPWATLQLRRRAPLADVVHFGDPLLTTLIPFLPAPRIPAAVTIHGLDILYPHLLYQRLLRRFLPRAQFAFCISRFVETETRRRFPSLRTTVLTPGISTSFGVPGATRADLGRRLGVHLPDGPLLLAVARLVQRKGIGWFVHDVLPRVRDSHLLVIGDGPERPNVLRAAAEAGVVHRLTLAGSVPPEVLKLAYSVTDLLVMPNISVSGDAEGFGLVALEAASAGLPVIAANLEGIPDAVTEGETGILVQPGDAAAWTDALARLLSDAPARARMRTRAPAVVRERYSWSRRAAAAVGALRQLTHRTEQ